MKVRILFFGATASAVGARELETIVDTNASPPQIIDQLYLEHPGLKSHRLLFAVNEEYVDVNTRLKDGDELAIFTAVSGG